MIINIGNSKIANEPEKLKEFTNIQLIYLAIVTVVSGLLTFILFQHNHFGLSLIPGFISFIGLIAIVLDAIGSITNMINE